MPRAVEPRVVDARIVVRALAQAVVEQRDAGFARFDFGGLREEQQGIIFGGGRFADWAAASGVMELRVLEING